MKFKALSKTRHKGGGGVPTTPYPIKSPSTSPLDNINPLKNQLNQKSSDYQYQPNRGGGKMQMLRDMSLKQDNWNLFVGDTRYKTNFFLQFLEVSTKRLYERHLLNTNIYSIRCTMLAMWFTLLFCFQNNEKGTFSYWQAFLASVLLIISMLGTKSDLEVSYIFLNIIRVRQTLLFVFPFFFGLRLVTIMGNGLTGQICAILLHLPTFYIATTYILPDWLDYALVATLQSIIVNFLLIPSIIPLWTHAEVLGFFIFLFACQEKSRKESWVVSHTNAKTKKILMGLLNQQPNPICIVTAQKGGNISSASPSSQFNSQGQIVYCNAMFEKMLSDRLGMPVGQVPQNIFRLTKNDEESTQKLKEFLQKVSSVSASKSSKPGQTLNNLKVSQQISQSVEAASSKIQIRLAKLYSSKYSPIQKPNKEENKSAQANNINLTNGHSKKFETLKDIFDHYEIAVVKADNVVYHQSQKSVMLTFNVVTEHKAKNQLLYVNSQTLYKNLIQFNRRLQQLYHQSLQSERSSNQGSDDAFTERQQSLIEFLGTTYLALNKIQQIAHEFQEEGMSFQPNNRQTQENEETFLLKEEILQCVESLSAKCLSQTASIKLDTKCLPERLLGDVSKFRLALHSVVEFALTYCKEGTIDILVNFSGMSPSGQYLIQFDFIFNRNKQYNEDPIVRLLNSLSAISFSNNGSNQKLRTEELLLKNYDDFFGLIQHFGMGMVIFPSLMMDLGGTYSIQVIAGDNLKNSQNEEVKGIPARDQDQSPYQAPSNNGHLKIQFKLPFNQAGLSQKVLNPYFPFNPNKEDTNGKQIFKSPMLKNRESRSRIKNDMKRIMEEQLKSPLLSVGRRPLGGISIGTPAGSGVFNPINESGSNSMASIGLGRIPISSESGGNKLQSLIPLKPEQVSNNVTGGQQHQGALNIVPQILEEEMKTESSVSLKKTNLSQKLGSDGSDTLNLGSGSKKENPSVSNQIITKPKVVKKVENALKNFEMNSGGNKQEFFKNFCGVIHPTNPPAAVTGSSLGTDDKHKVTSGKIVESQSQCNSPAQSFGIAGIGSHNTGTLTFNEKSEPNTQKANAQMESIEPLENFSDMQRSLQRREVPSVSLADSSQSSKGSGDIFSAQLNQNSNILARTGSASIFNGGYQDASSMRYKKGSSQNLSMSSKEPNPKTSGQATSNVARKTSLFGHMKRKQSNKHGDTCNSGKNEEEKRPFKKSSSSFDSDFNSEDKQKTILSKQNEHPLRRTSSQIINPQVSHEMIDDSFAGANQISAQQNSQNQPTSQQYPIKDAPSVTAIEGGEYAGSSTNIREVVSFGGYGTGQPDVSRMQSDRFMTQEQQHNFGSESSRNQGSRIIQGYDEESKGSNQLLNIGSSGVRRLGSSRALVMDSPVDRNLNQPLQMDSDAQSIKDQLNQYDEDEDNYYNDGDIDDEDENIEGQGIAHNNIPLSRQLTSWNQDNYSVSGQGASRGMMQSSPNTSVSMRHAGSIGRSSLQSPMLHAYPRIYPNNIDMRQPNEYYSTRGGGVVGPSTSRELTEIHPSYTEDGQISYPLQTRRQNTNDEINQAFPRKYSESQDQSWFMRGGDTVMQRIHPEHDTPYSAYSIKQSTKAQLGSQRPNHNMQAMEELIIRQHHKNERQGITTNAYQGDRTMRYQARLNQVDTLQQGQIRVWDRSLQERLEKERDEMEQANIAAQEAASGISQTSSFRRVNAPRTLDISKKYVLVVEDNTMISMILEQTLQTLGYTAIVAENGKIAIDKFLSFIQQGVLFELILMDIIMPVMGGYESTQGIRKLEQEFKLSITEYHFICGFSAEVNNEIIKKCEASGMNKILSKPMSATTLQQLLEENKRQTNLIIIPKE